MTGLSFKIKEIKTDANVSVFLLSLKIKHLAMESYKVLMQFYKLSDAKTYVYGDTVLLSKEQAETMIKSGQVEAIAETESISDTPKKLSDKFKKK